MCDIRGTARAEKIHKFCKESNRYRDEKEFGDRERQRERENIERDRERDRDIEREIDVR